MRSQGCSCKVPASVGIVFVLAGIVIVTLAGSSPALAAASTKTGGQLIPPVVSLLLGNRRFAKGTLNDTGLTWGGDYDSGNNTTCSGVDTDTGDPLGPQDCAFGRDVTHNDDSDGHAGFSFTKLDSSGNPLPASAASWSCVKDDVTGLIWEVKTDDNGLHDKDDTYNWYNTDPATNGGADGYADADGDICYGYDASDSATFCNTQAYVARVNAAGLCGANDWRMPTKKELLGIVDFGRSYPAIDTEYFPNQASSYVWSGSADAFDSDSAWHVNFINGYSSNYSRSSDHRVRLVRGGQ